MAMNQLNLFPNQQPAYKEGDVVNGKRVVRTKHGDLQLVPITGKTKAYYVEQARQLWGDKYDYTNSVYVENKKPIIIYCPKHDYHFRVAMAQNHILKPNGTFRPTGCPICEYERKYGGDFGPEWRDTLKLSANSNRVGLIRPKSKKHLLTPEQRAEREAKAEQRRREIEQRRQERERQKQERQRAYQEKLAQQKEATRRRHEEEKARLQAERERQKQQRIINLQERFRREAPKAQGEGYQYRGIENITTTTSLVDVHCPNPNHQWHPMRVDLILQGCKCRECAGRHQSLEHRHKMWEKNIIKKYGKSRFDFSEVEYVNNDTPVWVTCNIHHHRYQTTPDTLLRGGGGCPYCVASEGEAIIYGWLENHGVRFQHNEVQVPNDNILLPLLYLVPDFWLPDHNMFIEFNGDQHYENIPHFFKGKKVRTFDVQQLRDQQLRQYCHDNKIKLLEIPYEQLKNIPNILKKEVKIKKQK